MKKRILVAGAAGMAGHMIYRYLESLDKYHMRATTRSKVEGLDSYVVDIVTDLNEFISLVKGSDIDVVINCIGMLVKPSQESPTQAIFINSFFPHVLEDITKGTKTKVIHLSTDCIFDGKSGPYNELDTPTETNWYGRTKALGELNNDKDLTMRTSIIGPELKENGTGLFNWFMHQEGTVRGYLNHYWNGITTLEMAKQIHRVLSRDKDLTGVYHFCPRKPITKGDLLTVIRDIWEKNIEVELVEEENGQNKTLVNNRTKEYHPHIPSYPDQLKELKDFLVAV